MRVCVCVRARAQARATGFKSGGPNFAADPKVEEIAQNSRNYEDRSYHRQLKMRGEGACAVRRVSAEEREQERESGDESQGASDSKRASERT